jgi:hypothetical protein
MQGPHGRNGEGNWRIVLRQMLQEVRAVCKTRNQLILNSWCTCERVSMEENLQWSRHRFGGNQ